MQQTDYFQRFSNESLITHLKSRISHYLSIPVFGETRYDWRTDRLLFEFCYSSPDDKMIQGKCIITRSYDEKFGHCVNITINAMCDHGCRRTSPFLVRVRLSKFIRNIDDVMTGVKVDERFVTVITNVVKTSAANENKLAIARVAADNQRKVEEQIKDLGLVPNESFNVNSIPVYITPTPARVQVAADVNPQQAKLLVEFLKTL